MPLMLLLLSINSSVGQNLQFKKQVWCEKENVLIAQLPKTIVNQRDYELALNVVKKFSPNVLNIYEFTPKAKKILPVVKQIVLWSEKNTSVENRIICYKMHFVINESLLIYSEKILAANDLLSNKDFLTQSEIYRILTALHNGYLKLDAYNEVIKLIPLRKKYAYIDKFNNTMAEIELDLSIALYKTKKYEKAINSFFVMKEYYIKNDDFLFVSSMSNNIGLCYYKLLDNQKALFFFNLAQQELKKVKKKNRKSPAYIDFFKAVINTNIAKIDIQNKNFKKALSSYKDLIKKTKIEGEKNNIPESYLNIANIYFKNNDIDFAKIYLDSTRNNYFLALNIDKKIEYFETCAKIELFQGNLEKAIKLFELSDLKNDSVLKQQSKRESILAQTKYNFDEKEKALQLIKSNLKNKEKIALIQKIALILTIILLTMIGILLQKNIKKRRVIDRQNTKLKENLTEKEVLLKEIHHRVKNNLQVILGLMSLQSKKTKSAEAIQVLKDSERQINSIATVHQMLYKMEKLTVISIDEYIYKLVDELKLSFSNQNVITKIFVEKIFLTSEVSVPLGLIICELFTNSYKHAFVGRKGEINIYLKTEPNNSFVFSYTDNGQGFVKQSGENKSTLGLKLLKMLAEELNGTITINGDHSMQAIVKFNKK